MTGLVYDSRMRNPLILLVAATTAPLLAQGTNLPHWYPAAAQGPDLYSGSAAVYDAARSRIVCFGGRNQQNQHLLDTWAWDGSSWTPINQGGPSGREYHSMSYDAVRDRIVVYGGGNQVVFSDTWEFDGTTWYALTPASNPGARQDHRTAFHAASGRTILFGGQGPTGIVLQDTWAWDGVNWTQLAPSSPTPGPRYRYAMTATTTTGPIVMFGGRSDLGGTWLGDTWQWDGQSWAQAASSGPRSRELTSITYDSQRRRVVLHGGFGIGDTWEWTGSDWFMTIPDHGQYRYRHSLVHFASMGVTISLGGKFGGSGQPLPSANLAYDPRAGLATSFGSGCGSPALAIAMAPSSRPSLGDEVVCTYEHAPTSLCFMMLGWSNTQAGPLPLPFGLWPYGMPGCLALTSSEINTAMQPASATSGTYRLALPYWPQLLGMRLYLQAWAPAPGTNMSNTITSNGLAWVVGN